MRFYNQSDFPTPSVTPDPDLPSRLVADAVDAYCWQVQTQCAYLELTGLL